MLKEDLEATAVGMTLKRRHAFLDDIEARPPGDMPARDGVMRSVEAALGPVHDGKKLNPALVEGLIDVLDRLIAIKLGPAARPDVTFFKSGAPKPIVEGKIDAILDAHPLLKRRPYHMDAAKRFFREPSEIRLGILIDEQHAMAVMEELVRGDDPGESAAGDDDFGFESLHCQDLANVETTLNADVGSQSARRVDRAREALPRARLSSEIKRALRDASGLGLAKPMLAGRPIFVFISRTFDKNMNHPLREALDRRRSTVLNLRISCALHANLCAAISLEDPFRPC